MPNSPSGFEAQLVRQFPHPIARVYRAWTMVEHIEQWFCPSDDIKIEIEQFDLREGGEFRFLYTWPGNVFPVQGTFLTVKPEQTLIFTWTPHSPDPDAGKDTLVSVFFRPLSPNETEVEVRHTLFPDELMRQRHNDGWCGTMNRLGRFLSK